MEIFENKKYKVITYGCQMNVHESEKICKILENMGMQKTDENNDADVIVFNTCCIREGAENRAFSNIMKLKPLKKTKRNLIVVVCGCMPQQKNPKYDPKNDIKVADIVLGTSNIYLLGEMLKKFVITKKKIVDTTEIVENIELDSLRDDKYNAYVNIIYGCNNFCTYCIVPYVRGRERSRKLSDIIAEVKDLAKQGYKYITLLGQNVNSYGKDLNDGSSFASLLTELCKIEGDFKIKFMTSHPKDLSDDVIEVLKNKKMARALHLPVQSGSDKILKLMNRKYDIAHYLSIIQKVRKSVPDMAISTDIIVGFPGESDADFEATYDLVKNVRYNQVFAYIYSKRSGTPACNMSEQIPYKLKNERVNLILNEQKDITNDLLNDYVGKIYNCLIVKPNIALTDAGKEIRIITPSKEVDVFKNIEIKYTKSKILYGEIKE